MKHFATGWACNLNDLFVRFPYEKCKSVIRSIKKKLLQRLKIKLVFRAGISAVLEDIIENNSTFVLPSVGIRGGEMHMEAIVGEEFEEARRNGKFRDVDFLESLFTGYLLYLYIHGKKDNFLAKRKFPVYVGRALKDKLTEYTNQGKVYG